MTVLTPIDDATNRQRIASDPRISAFVSANAGSGKTHVLVQRVIRLLLAGVMPSRILALTYTKAAAANMANRVFTTLGDWVSLSDAELAAKLREIDGTVPDAARLALARRLFASAIETPGGLKIQTIHAFCERLLQLFPFEANVAARFEVLDDMHQAELIAGARRDVLLEAARGTDKELQNALRVVTDIAADETLQKLLKQAMSLRETLSARGATPETREEFVGDLREFLGLERGETLDVVDALIVDGALTESESQGAVAALTFAGSATNVKVAAKIQKAQAVRGKDAGLWRQLYCDIFLNADGSATKSIVTTPVKEKRPDIAARLTSELERITALMARRRAAETVERTHALLIVADAVLTRYQAAKASRGALDFEDLIERTNALLYRVQSSWVLYKLDRGIDHLLVDEAQDTSPRQWAILRALTDEFFSGSSDTMRTIFAVGDPKQSIYSFQGARPQAFADSRTHFKTRVEQAKTGDERYDFQDVKLEMSFRSASDVLDAVDRVFKLEAHHRGLEHEPKAPVHLARNADLPGLIELWPLKKHDDEPDYEDWSAPLDSISRAAPVAQLASDVARTIAGWIAPGSTERVEGLDPVTRTRIRRPIRASDVMILVRSRNALFDTVIRALKDAHVPVAGADRLALTQHIAVMDLMALGCATLLPEDDLTLATVLKSPLFGLDDDALMQLAPERPGSLHAALASSVAHASVFQKFERWRALACERGPFGFYSTVLGADGGRAMLLGRLGIEAGDAVDAFLSLALDHEHRATPSLQTFLADLAEADLTIKRDMEASGNQVRVMTVHGSKGLEAPIVFLPDTCGGPGKGQLPNLMELETGSQGGAFPVWALSEKVDTVAVNDARGEALERSREEHRRLLYVALTRAQERVYVAGFTNAKGKAPDGCWYDIISQGLDGELEPVPEGEGVPGALRRQKKPYDNTVPHLLGAPVPSATAALPAWLRHPAPVEKAPLPPLRPSGAIDAADQSARPLDSPFARKARRIGTLVHRLLEVLPDCPVDRRADAAATLVRTRGKGLDTADRDKVVSQVLSLLARPNLAPLFGPDSRAEVAIAGELPVGAGGAMRPVSGQIDRLAVTDQAVFIADYKTNTRAPHDAADLDPAHVSQVAIYRALLAPLYPGRDVRGMIVFTTASRVIEIPPVMLDAALASISIP